MNGSVPEVVGWVIMYPCYPCRDGYFRGTLRPVTSIGGAGAGIHKYCLFRGFPFALSVVSS
jgi:hypothetical protein